MLESIRSVVRGTHQRGRWAGWHGDRNDERLDGLQLRCDTRHRRHLVSLAVAGGLVWKELVPPLLNPKPCTAGDEPAADLTGGDTELVVTHIPSQAATHISSSPAHFGDFGHSTPLLSPPNRPTINWYDVTAQC